MITAQWFAPNKFLCFNPHDITFKFYVILCDLGAIDRQIELWGINSIAMDNFGNFKIYSV